MNYLLSLVFLVTSVTSFAGTLNNSIGATFASNEVTVNVANLSCDNLGVTADELLSLAEEAVERFWNRVPTSALKLSRGNLVNVANDFKTGEICLSGDCTDLNQNMIVSDNILIACNNNSANFNNSSSVLGVTLPNNVSGSTINGSIILLQDSSGNQFANQEREEQISILAHEIGHGFGLGHTKNDHNLMYYLSYPNRETVGKDDAHMISLLYPKEQPFSGCGTIQLGNKPPPSGPWFLSFLLGALLLLSFRSIKGRGNFNSSI